MTGEDGLDEVRKRINEMVDDFKYLGDFLLDIIDGIPGVYFNPRENHDWYEKAKQCRNIYNKYWADGNGYVVQV